MHEVYWIDEGLSARKALNMWKADALVSGICQMQRLHNTVLHWQEEILNFWKHRITSAITEGKIRKLRKLNRAAYNYSNFDRLRSKMLEQEDLMALERAELKRRAKDAQTQD